MSPKCIESLMNLIKKERKLVNHIKDGQFVDSLCTRLSDMKPRYVSMRKLTDKNGIFWLIDQFWVTVVVPTPILKPSLKHVK